MAGWIILAVLVCLIAVLLVRAALVKAPAQSGAAPAPVTVDGEAAAQHLAQMVRIPTVSNYDESLVDDAQFEAFRALLRQLYPAVHAACPPVRCGKTGLLFRWQGKSAAAPTVLMAHYDVVPVAEEQWQHPPFCGEVFDGELWGRGTLDTKITVLGVLEAAEKRISEGFVPANDVYFAFAGDEEVAGHGAEDIIAHFKETGVQPAMVLDEGGAVVQGIFPGVREPIAVIGIGEKGMMNVEFTARSEGGHASHPVLPSTLGMLCKAVVNCEEHPMPAHLTQPIRAMLETLTPYMPFGMRILTANLWCFGGLLCAMSSKLGGEINAMMRTTFAFTQAEGSKQNNVIPSVARAGLNVRLVNNDTMDSTVAYLNRRIANDKVSVRVVHGMDASPYADTAGAHWQALRTAVADTWRGSIVSPYLMIACSDSRHYNGWVRDIYKFSAMQLSTEQRGLIHNNNERIPVTEVARTVEFFARLMEKL